MELIDYIGWGAVVYLLCGIIFTSIAIRGKNFAEQLSMYPDHVKKVGTVLIFIFGIVAWPLMIDIEIVRKKTE